MGRLVMTGGEDEGDVLQWLQPRVLGRLGLGRNHSSPLVVATVPRQSQQPMAGACQGRTSRPWLASTPAM